MGEPKTKGIDFPDSLWNIATNQSELAIFNFTSEKQTSIFWSYCAFFYFISKYRVFLTSVRGKKKKVSQSLERMHISSFPMELTEL